MKLRTFLKACRSDLWDKKIKLVRHVDDQDLELLLREGHFDEYQTRQGTEVFNCDLIVSFLGEAGARSRFVGVYTVNGVHDDGKSTPHSPDFPFKDMKLSTYRYDLSRVDGFDALHDRLVIDWGASTRAWHQWLNDKSDKNVIELLPRGYVREFSGYEDVHLRFDELKRLVEHPDANRLWHKMLAGVAGIYLIVDGATGDQYIGSAYGEKGLLGRWRNYVDSKHGDNKRLRELLTKDPQRYTAFSFSILRTLSRSLTSKEVIAIEGRYKLQLGTRAFGLNAN